MHEKTRRLLCRIAFLGLCVLPTTAVLAWIGWRAMPGRVTAQETELSEKLGLAVSLEGISHPRPGHTLLKGVKLADPETGATVARVRVVEMVRRHGELVLLASQAEVETGRLDLLWEVLDRRILRQSGPRLSNVRLVAGEVTLHGPGGSRTLTGVQGRIERLAAGRQATVGFRLAGLDMSQPAQIVAVRNRQIDPPATRLELHTGGGALPCELFSPQGRWLGLLGERAAFRGSVWATAAADGWEGELAGRFERVDLDLLVSDHFPHKLSGNADFVVSGARFRAGRIEQAAGCIQAGPGVVSRGLLDAAAESLGVSSRAPDRDDRDLLLPYRQLAVAFVIDGSMVELRGLCDAAPPGTILADAAGPLLGESHQGPSPVIGLVRTLVPESTVQVPATPETDALLGWLPLPPVTAPEGRQARSWHGRLRLGDRTERR